MSIQLFLVYVCPSRDILSIFIYFILHLMPLSRHISCFTYFELLYLFCTHCTHIMLHYLLLLFLENKDSEIAENTLLIYWSQVLKFSAKSNIYFVWKNGWIQLSIFTVLQSSRRPTYIPAAAANQWPPPRRHFLLSGWSAPRPQQQTVTS